MKGEPEPLVLADGTLVRFELQEDGTRRVVEPMDLSGREIIQVKVGFILLALLLWVVPVAAGPFPTTYDLTIQGAWEQYHPADDWRWWKAQLWQESRLDPNAVSPVGATGIAQFMRGTAAQYGLVDRRMAEPSIYAGAKMMRDLRRYWRAPRTAQSRRRLSQASYNGGAGNLTKAQRLCGGPNEYEDIALCLRLLPDFNYRETLGYPPSIERWYMRMQ